MNAHLDMSAWISLGLDEKIIQGLRHLGFEEPTPVQQACLSPAIRDFRDILAAAETGSGKTLAFGLPILQHILHRREKVRTGQCPRLVVLGELPFWINVP